MTSASARIARFAELLVPASQAECHLMGGREADRCEDAIGELEEWATDLIDDLRGALAYAGPSNAPHIRADERRRQDQET